MQPTTYEKGIMMANDTPVFCSAGLGRPQHLNCIQSALSSRPLRSLNPCSSVSQPSELVQTASELMTHVPETYSRDGLPWVLVSHCTITASLWVGKRFHSFRGEKTEAWTL